MKVHEGMSRKTLKISSLDNLRLKYEPKVISCLTKPTLARLKPDNVQVNLKDEIKQQFPNTSSLNAASIVNSDAELSSPLKIGVLFSGGQAPGGHNVICGLFDALQKGNTGSMLLGFIDGPSSLLTNNYIVLDSQKIDSVRNLGGFDLLGSGRKKISTKQEFEQVLKNATEIGLNAIVIIGGDDSNTNAAFLAEYFKNSGSDILVIGVPKTIDGDLQNEHVDISFGFDTASKVYSQLIGNVAKDAISAKKYYFFIKLMGRSASHIALECALNTCPNLCLIGEEIAAKQMNLHQVVCQIADLVAQRTEVGKNYGIILIPEGVVEFIKDFKQLVTEISASKVESLADLSSLNLSEESKSCLLEIPPEVQRQLLVDKDSHGNIQLSKIDTERLLLKLVDSELKLRSEKGDFKGSFNGQPLFFGYEGRCALPSNFDANYCYNLGVLAFVLINNGCTGLMTVINNLKEPVANWQPQGVPIIWMMHQEEKNGAQKLVVQKNLVNLNGPAYKSWQKIALNCTMQDQYLSPGPLQFNDSCLPPKIISF